MSQNPKKKSLTGLKIGRDTRMWLENRRKGLRGGIGTDGRRKAVKEIGREKRKNLMKQSKNRHWKEKDKKRQQEIGRSTKSRRKPTHPLFGSQVKKRVPPKRGTGPHRCVYTNPPTPTQSDSGPRASKEDKRNPHTHLRGPEKLVRIYV